LPTTFCGKKIFYHNKTQECDFVLVEDKTITAAIQVCYAFPSEKVKKREIDGLLDALLSIKPKSSNADSDF
jgi:predicted AAA+ superfamily ATPase